MKFTYLFYLCFFLFSCGSSPKQSPTPTEDDKVVIKNDELEYEVIIIEPGFNSWLVTQPPQNFYTQTALEIKNRRWVSEWNRRVLQPYNFNPNLYEMQINYDASIDYGMEVNYLLFQYFTYFQQKYRQNLY